MSARTAAFSGIAGRDHLALPGQKRPSAVTSEFGDYLIDRQCLHKIQDAPAVPAVCHWFVSLDFIRVLCGEAVMKSLA